MIKYIQLSKYFYFPTLLVFIIGLIGLMMISTGDLILGVSEYRLSEMNTFFAWGTKLGEELTYFFLLIVFLFINIRYALMLPIIGVVVTIVSYALKSFFLQPRPKLFFKELLESGQINIIEGYHIVGGLTSFPSGHTTSAFCLFGFTAYAFTKLKHARLLQFSCFLLALIVGFSRIYLFQHFLKDVVAGIFLGSLLAILLTWFSENYLNTPGKWYNQSINNYFSKSSVQRA